MPVTQNNLKRLATLYFQDGVRIKVANITREFAVKIDKKLKNINEHLQCALGLIFFLIIGLWIFLAHLSRRLMVSL